MPRRENFTAFSKDAPCKISSTGYDGAMVKKNKKTIKKKKIKKVTKVIKKKARKVAKKKVVKKVRKVKKAKKVVRKIVRKKIVDNISQDTVHKTRVRIIGVGGGGGTIVSEITSRIKRADFVVANTDAKALRNIKRAKKFQFGQSITNGLGTGMNVEVGEEAALEEKDKVEKLFEGQDLCIIVSSLGGGAGSGASSVFAKISKNTSCLTYGIFTMPFEFEGEKKMEIAREALDKIRPHLNAFSVIPNERIFKIIDKNTPLKDALSAINERLAENLQGLIEMIYLPGLINIDFADLKTILSGRGKLAYLNTVEINEPDKEEAVKKVISSPLYPYTIKGAKGVVYNIVGGKAIQLSDVSKISKIISESINKNAKIIFGINQSQKSPGKIKMTLLATGCATKDVIKRPIRKRIIKIIKKPVIKKEVEEPKVEEKPEEPEIKKEKKPEPTKKLVVVKPAVKKPVIKKPVVEKKPEVKKEIKKPVEEDSGDIKVRRNALQVRRAIEQEENEFLEREKVWETPAILRRNKE